MMIQSCQEKMNVLSEKILNRIYQIKGPIQSSNWDHLDIDGKLEQLVDINDSLFEQIVSEEYELSIDGFIRLFQKASSLDIADGIKTSSISTVVVNYIKHKYQFQMNFRDKF
jgi:hypothetical protein